MFGIKLPCFHKWVKSRFQFQALNTDGTTTSYTCEKCGKLKIEDD